MLDLDSFAVDPKMATEGVWAPYYGGQFLIARPGPEYQARLMELYMENKDLIGKGTPEGKAKDLEISKIAIGEKVLIGWKDICDKKKKVIPYTKERSVELMLNPAFYELQQFIENFSNIRENFQVRTEREVATDVKNTADS